MQDEANKALEVARLILDFGRVKRVTLEEDGTTPETDTTHTVMIGVLACALAARVRPDLDIGRIAQFALVHDLVEAYAGDTDTFGQSAVEFFKEKEEREQHALSRIKTEFDDVYPWIGATIEAYESLSEPEARFIKTLDKCMPKLTHLLNDGAYLRSRGATAEDLQAFLESQREKIVGSYAADQPEVLALFDELADMMVGRLRESQE